MKFEPATDEVGPRTDPSSINSITPFHHKSVFAVVSWYVVVLDSIHGWWSDCVLDRGPFGRAWSNPVLKSFRRPRKSVYRPLTPICINPSIFLHQNSLQPELSWFVLDLDQSVVASADNGAWFGLGLGGPQTPPVLRRSIYDPNLDLPFHFFHQKQLTVPPRLRIALALRVRNVKTSKLGPKGSTWGVGRPRKAQTAPDPQRSITNPFLDRFLHFLDLIKPTARPLLPIVLPPLVRGVQISIRGRLGSILGAGWVGGKHVRTFPDR